MAEEKFNVDQIAIMELEEKVIEKDYTTKLLLEEDQIPESIGSYLDAMFESIETLIGDKEPKNMSKQPKKISRDQFVKRIGEMDMMLSVMLCEHDEVDNLKRFMNAYRLREKMVRQVRGFAINATEKEIKYQIDSLLSEILITPELAEKAQYLKRRLKRLEEDRIKRLEDYNRQQWASHRHREQWQTNMTDYPVPKENLIYPVEREFPLPMLAELKNSPPPPPLPSKLTNAHIEELDKALPFVKDAMNCIMLDYFMCLHSPLDRKSHKSVNLNEWGGYILDPLLEDNNKFFYGPFKKYFSYHHPTIKNDYTMNEMRNNHSNYFTYGSYASGVRIMKYELEDIIKQTISLAEREVGFKKFKCSDEYGEVYDKHFEFMKIGILSGGIADGKTEFIQKSAKQLDNEYSHFFRLKLSDPEEDEGIFMPKRYYPIFIFYGLIDKLIEAFQNFRDKVTNVVYINRSYSDHQFFAFYDGLYSPFTPIFYLGYLHLLVQMTRVKGNKYFTSSYQPGEEIIKQLVYFILPSRAYNRILPDKYHFGENKWGVDNPLSVPYPFYPYREMEASRFKCEKDFRIFLVDMFEHHKRNILDKEPFDFIEEN
jgi:hypothetical protein